MGCDIHLHTEVKINGKWEHYSEAPHVKRDYELFTLMAGVRGDTTDPCISPPRGLPHDVSFLTKFISDYDGPDGHSHSYLTAEEIPILEKFFEEKRKDNFPEKQWGYFFGNTWGEFSLYPNDRPKGIEDVRFVFWFDN